jgi:hypothetical protein
LLLHIVPHDQLSHIHTGCWFLCALVYMVTNCMSRDWFVEGEGIIFLIIMSIPALRQYEQFIRLTMFFHCFYVLWFVLWCHYLKLHGSEMQDDLWLGGRYLEVIMTWWMYYPGIFLKGLSKTMSTWLLSPVSKLKYHPYVNMEC